MFAGIRIQGLGPHRDTAERFDAHGVSELRGPSEAGKSTTVDAMCFALWGCDRRGRPLSTAAIHDEADEARVDLTLRSGTVLTRVLTRPRGKASRGETSRTMRRRGETHEYRTEKDWQGALRKLGEQPEVLRNIMAPRAWLRLAYGAGSGRPLRNLLDDALPTGGTKAQIIAALMAKRGQAFREGDPVREEHAIELRRRQGTRRDKAAGRVDGLQRALEDLEKAPAPMVPDAGNVSSAQDTLDREQQWARDDIARERASERAKSVEALTEAAKRWDRDIADLGEEPSGAEDAHDVAARLSKIPGRRLKLRGQRQEIARDLPDDDELERRDPRRPDGDLVGRYNQAKRSASDARAALESASDVCPTCKRPGWDLAVATLQQRVEELDAEAKEIDKQVKIQSQQRALEEVERRKAAQVRHQEIRAKLAEIDEQLEQVERDHDQLQQRHADLQASNQPAAEWRRRRRQLGDRPRVPESIPAPPDPTCQRPTTEQAEEARRVLEAHERGRGAIARRKADIDTTAASLDQARADLENAQAEHARLDVLVAAVRAEPSESVRRQLSALGDLGPVSIELLEGGGVEVKIDGRPWHLASHGRQIVGDVWLRAGLRRAVGVPIPLVIDDVQGVGGQPLPSPPPSILLRTTDDHELEVVALAT